jgi:hypothetical protein
MTAAVGDNLGLVTGWAPGDDGWSADMDANLRKINGLTWFTTKVTPLNAPPASPAVGDRYIIGTSPSGAWTGHANALTVYQTDEAGTSAWAFYVPKEGWDALVLDVSGTVAPVTYLFRGSVWSVEPAITWNGGSVTALGGGLNLSGGTLSATVTSVAGRTGNVTIGVADVTGAEATANKGVSSGYAGLDGSGKVPTAQLPASVLGGLTYQGTWNATTNSPTLASGTGTTGFYYVVSTAGTTTIDGVSTWGIGDWIAFDGTKWDKLDGSANPVTSVAGRQGAVTLSASDISGGWNAGTVSALGATLNINSGTVDVATSAALKATPAAPFTIGDSGIGTLPALPAAANNALIRTVGTAGAAFLLQTFGIGNGPNMIGAHAGGTPGAMTATPNGQAMAGMTSIGHNGTVYTGVQASYSQRADALWTPTSQPTHHRWSVTPSGSTIIAEAMRLQATGALVIGQTTDDGVNKLQVNGGVKGTILTATGMPSSDPGVAGELWKTTTGQVAVSGTTPTLPLGFIIPGKPTASQVYNLPMAASVVIPASLAGSVTYDGTLPTANAVFTLNRVNSGGTIAAMGTITVQPASHTSKTLAGAGGTLAVGDVLQIVCPGTQDVTLADVGITILATKV